MNKDTATVWQFTQKDILLFIGVFVAYFIAAKFSLTIYTNFETSPALIWPPVGIAIAAVILGGYRMLIPLFFAQFFATYLYNPEIPDIWFMAAVGYSIQAAAALFVLKTFGFSSEFGKLKDVLLLIGVALFITTIQPTIMTIYRIAADVLMVSPLLNLARGWGAGIFSVLAFTPIIVKVILRSKNFLNSPLREKLEALAAFVTLTFINYIVFWTVLPQFIGILVIFLLPGVLIWFALRLHPRWLTIATCVTAIQSVAGTIIARASDNPLNEQLLAVQIYTSLVFVIFYVLAAVVEERRSAYAKLAESYDAILASDKAKNDFIAILAHELRNPLAPVISSLELLKLGSRSVPEQQTLDNALGHTLMMRRLLDDLLDMARLVQNKITLRKETVELKRILEQSVASIEEQAKNRNINLKVQLPNDDMFVYVDPIRLKQIIINLLNNACKYTHRGGTVVLTYGMDGNDFFIQVADNGVGIASDTITHIFEPFRQIEGSPRYGSGLGIGLFLTKHLVQMHDGTIEVHSSGVGKGSTFTVYLPHPETLPQIIEKTMPTLSPSVSRILIVDDNEAAANILQKLLTLHKQDVEVAYSGKDALLKISTFDPDVIFLDIGMPDMDGYETARHLREKNWKGTIIALSGYGQDSDKERSKAAGFNHHLVKPVGIEEILAVIETSKNGTTFQSQDIMTV